MSTFGLDVLSGAKVAQRETYGEWYRDPWGWPELDPNFVSQLDFAIYLDVRPGTMPLRLESAFHSFAFPKSFTGTRPAVIMDAATRLMMTASSMYLTKPLHEELPAWVFGWRYRDGALDSDEWQLYSDSQSNIGKSEHAAQTDITSFFASVDNQRLVDRVEELRGRSAALGVVSQVLSAHDRLAGRSGLPQRSIASSWLAHVAVQGIDDLLQERISAGLLTGTRRWMDDISFEGDVQELQRTILDIQERGRQVGLEINGMKTRISSGPEIAQNLEEERRRLIRVERIDEAAQNDYFDIFDVFISDTELGEAEDRILRSPATASRAEAGLVLRSLRHYWVFDRVTEWMRVAPYLPHAADHLGRFLADAHKNSFLSPNVPGWFLSLQIDRWHHLPWTRAQHSLAVASEEATDEVRAVWLNWVEASNSLQQVATATQRLTARSTSLVRSVMSARIDNCADPLLIRVLALGLIAANGDRRIVDRALERHPSNRLTRAYLHETNWRLPAVSQDFDPPGN